MAHIVVIGAGLGGLPAAYEIRHLLTHQHRITLISNQPRFTFVPSLPWVCFRLLTGTGTRRGINLRGTPRYWQHGKFS
jgi:sulfide:quinone oxidoreductase